MTNKDEIQKELEELMSKNLDEDEQHIYRKTGTPMCVLPKADIINALQRTREETLREIEEWAENIPATVKRRQWVSREPEKDALAIIEVNHLLNHINSQLKDKK